VGQWLACLLAYLTALSAGRGQSAPLSNPGPNLRAQFEAAPGARFTVLHSVTDDLYHRLEARLGVLEAIVQGLAGPGGEH